MLHVMSVCAFVCTLVLITLRLSLVVNGSVVVHSCSIFFFQAEDGIRDAQESRGLGDVYKRQSLPPAPVPGTE